MIVNGKEYKIEDLVADIDFTKNSFQTVGGMMLTNREIEILRINFIEYETCTSLKDLAIKIEEVLDDEMLDEDNLEDLEFVLDSICERSYYECTKK